MKKETKANKNRTRMILVLVISVIFIVSAVSAAIAVRNYRLLQSVEFVFSGNLEQRSARNIEISEEEQAERVKAMKRKGQKSKFDFFCNSEIEFEYGTDYGSLVLANVSTNDCILVASILTDDGTLIYRSGGIEPGRYISQIRLFAPPEDGEHNCRVFVTAYEKDTYELIGVQYTDLTIWIGERTDAEK